LPYANCVVKTPNHHSNKCNRSSLLATSLLLVLALVCPASLSADDGALTANPAGGLEWKREPRVSMEKERLTISLAKVTVEFEFLNDSEQDVTAQVGFPIPPYVFEQFGGPTEQRDRPVSWDFADFAVWVDDKPLQYQTERRAFVNGVEHTEILEKLGINIGSFGDKELDPMLGVYDESEPDDQLTRLPKDHKEQLIKLGLISEGCRPLWTVREMHHWTQTFPARKTVRIRHEYAPAVGRSPLFADSFREFEEICVDEALFNHVKTQARKRADWHGHLNWVKYILTSANTWKTPIKDFELVVDKSGAHDVRFCWDGKIEKLDANRVVARAKDFVPTKELTIYFLHVVDAD
jgi:hypothetical protein